MTAPVVTEQAYRYWTYWVLDSGQWSFSQVAPAGTLPEDGAVQGWRFAVTTIAGNSSSTPRTDPALAFERACAGITAPAGSKRVAIVIDSGEAALAPSAQVPPAPRAACAVVDADATGAQSLSSIANLRVEDGLVCAIDGYPSGECAVTLNSGDLLASTTTSQSSQQAPVDVLAASPTQTATAATNGDAQTAAGSPLAVGITAVLLLAGLCVAWWLQRRRLRGTR